MRAAVSLSNHQPAVIPILWRIRESLLSAVLGPVTVNGGNQPALLANVQSALDALTVVGSTTSRPGL